MARVDGVPSLSAVMVVYARSRLVPLVLENLALQTIAPAMEIILVTTTREELCHPVGDIHRFCSLKIVEAGDIRKTGLAKALGVAAAQAPLVMFLEDHSFPEPGCAEALVVRHQTQPLAAVGPVMLNANPASAVSWGTFLVFYGQWFGNNLPTEVHHLPANHSCYRHEILMAYGSQLADMLEVESVLHWDLITRGEHLYLDPAARVYHLNYSSVAPLLKEYFYASRVFAANRAALWGAGQRTVYALGSALLPLIRWRRVAKQAALSRLASDLLVRSSPALFLNLCAGAAGELLGYLLGTGRSAECLARFEKMERRQYPQADVKAAAELLSSFGPRP